MNRPFTVGKFAGAPLAPGVTPDFRPGHWVGNEPWSFLNSTGSSPGSATLGPRTSPADRG